MQGRILMYKFICSLRCVMLLAAASFLLGATIAGCGGACPFGREVVIPSTDTTGPALTLDIFLPGGRIVSVTPNSVPAKVIAPANGRVTLTAKASDDQGVKDVQLRIRTITCTKDPDTEAETCSFSVDRDVPTASNPDNRTPGQKGCTERLVSHNVVVRNSPTGSESHVVEARGVNFGGKEVRLSFRLEAK